MKVLCQRERLRDGLAVVGSVIPVKSPRPAIENVFLSANDRGLELVGTDLEVAVRYRVDEDAKIAEPGTALIPARVAAEFVRDLSGETVAIETVPSGNASTGSGETCVVTSSADRCELVTVDPDEFPVVPRFDPEGSLTIQAGVFQKLVTRTAFATAREPGRYAMHGILTLIEDGVLRLVATDGRRLAVSHAPVDAAGSGPRRAIVPTKGMQLFARAMEDPLNNVKLHFGENQIGVSTERAELFARLIEGEFPGYADVIPIDTQNSVEADADLFHKKLRLVSNITANDTRAVKLSFSKGEMEIFARSAGRGEASGRLEVDYRGSDSQIAFNPDYVIDGLKNCETDTVRMEFREHTSPGKFFLGEDYVYIVMPITIDN